MKKEPLTLSDSQASALSFGQMVDEQLALPKIPAIDQLPGILPQLAIHQIPLPRTQLSQPSRPLPFPQTGKASGLKTH